MKTVAACAGIGFVGGGGGGGYVLCVCLHNPKPFAKTLNP